MLLTYIEEAMEAQNSLVVSGIRCLVNGQVSGDAGEVGVGPVVEQQLDTLSVS